MGRVASKMDDDASRQEHSGLCVKGCQGRSTSLTPPQTAVRQGQKSTSTATANAEFVSEGKSLADANETEGRKVGDLISDLTGLETVNRHSEPASPLAAYAESRAASSEWRRLGAVSQAQEFEASRRKGAQVTRQLRKHLHHHRQPSKSCSNSRQSSLKLLEQNSGSVGGLSLAKSNSKGNTCGPSGRCSNGFMDIGRALEQEEIIRPQEFGGEAHLISEQDWREHYRAPTQKPREMQQQQAKGSLTCAWSGQIGAHKTFGHALMGENNNCDRCSHGSETLCCCSPAPILAGGDLNAQIDRGQAQAHDAWHQIDQQHWPNPRSAKATGPMAAGNASSASDRRGLELIHEDEGAWLSTCSCHSSRSLQVAANHHHQHHPHQHPMSYGECKFRSNSRRLSDPSHAGLWPRSQQQQQCGARLQHPGTPDRELGERQVRGTSALKPLDEQLKKEKHEQQQQRGDNDDCKQSRRASASSEPSTKSEFVTSSGSGKSDRENNEKLQSKLFEASGLSLGGGATTNNNNNNNNNKDWNNIDWKDIARRYREMPRQHRGQFWHTMRHSCLCHLFLSSLSSMFPILTSFKNYSLPGDLVSDLMAGFTVAVLHIPQGMAYGMLSGVEPIYGLYVSFIPVLIMALMSKSRHVSYGTFAVISMLLANSIDSVRIILKQQVEQAGVVGGGGESTVNNSIAQPLTGPMSAELGALIITNNHQPPDPAQKVLRDLLLPRFLDPEQAYQISAANSTPGDGATTTTASSSSFLSDNFWTFNPQADFIMPTNIEILTSICLLTGLVQMIMALSRLGILSLMFSDQLVSGFTTASAVNVVTSQIPGLFDLGQPQVPEGLFKICRIWWAIANRLLEGSNQYTALVSLFSFIFLLTIKEIIEPLLKRRFKTLTCLPSELTLMTFLVFASWFWKFEQNFGINTVGHVPTGLPAPQVPRLDLAPLVIKDSLTIALVSFALNLSLAQVYAKRFKYSMDPNQELFALGTANFVGSFFSCYPCASSLSRSAIQSNMNVKSQLCSLFSCGIVVSIICYFAPILHDLPRAALSCIIIVALKGILVQVRDLFENWRLSKLDALVWLMTFMSVIALGIAYGLIVGMAASLLMMLFRLLTPNHSILGHLPGTDIFVDISAFLDCKEIKNIKIFRFNSALCYLNRTMFKSCVEKSLPEIYRQSRGFRMFCSRKQKIDCCDSNRINFLIIDCSALAYCDYSGAATLVDLVEELEEYKVEVYLAACPLKLVNMIERMQKMKILEQNVYPTITDAINFAKYLKGRASQASLSDYTVESSCVLSLISSVP